MSPRGWGATACPFLAQEEEDSCCLSKLDDPAPVGTAYVSSYCLTSRHLTCPWFRHADVRARRAALDRNAGGEPPVREERTPTELPLIPRPAAPDVASPARETLVFERVPRESEADGEKVATAADAPTGPVDVAPPRKEEVRLEAEERRAEAREAEEAEPAAFEVEPLPDAEVSASNAALPADGRPSVSWRLLLTAGICLSVLAAAAIAGPLGIRPGASRPAGQPATASSRTAVAKSAPAPARVWSFPAVGAAEQTILALNNPGAARAAVDVSAPGTRQRVTLKAESEAEMELGPTARTGRIGIRSTAPIIVERIVVSKGKTYTSYGSRG